jgi:hypothetical protein
MCRSPTERRKEEEKVEDENSTSNNSENVSYSTNSCGIDFDALRQIGDPLADEVMRTIPPAFQQQKMASLILDNGRIQKRTFSLDTALQMERIRLWFGQMMPFSGLVLLCGSLPAAYSAAKGATVLRCTGRMQKEPRLRIIETLYFLHQIFEHSYICTDGQGNSIPINLEDHAGFQAVVKVRLLHARVRQHILKASEKVTPNSSNTGSGNHESYFVYNVKEMGVPINQEDMMGTSTVFSHILLLGLQRLGIYVSEEQRQDYAAFWNQIGQWMGVQYSFKNLEDEQKVCQCIFERHSVPDQYSKQLVQQLYGRVMPAQLSDRRKAKISRAFCTLTHMMDQDLAEGLELEYSKYHVITWTVSIWMFKLFLFVDSIIVSLLGFSLRRTLQTMGFIAQKVMKEAGIDTPFEFRLA